MSASETRQLLDGWERLYAARTDWAEAAVAQHLDGFAPEVRDRLATRDREATIALYGPTQVGKTTLILKMLGVADTCAPKVGEVLRGGRPAGESATATAMRYRVSDDDRWTWIDGADLITGADEGDIQVRLRDLRSSVESGSRDPGAAPVEVGIPRCLLDAEAAPLPIRIIDLPGIQSATAAEKAHVRDLAGRYLPHADVIVILGKADSLEFLKPQVLAMPELLDWWDAPHQFRIVLTHAYLLGTAKEFVRTHPADHEVPLADIRDHYLEQIRTHDFPADISWDQMEEILYPLEYGQSWDAPTDDAVRRRVERANSTAFETLRSSLTALASTEKRLAQTYHAYQVAAAMPKRRIQQERAVLSEIKERIGRIEDDLADRRSTREQLRARRDRDRGVLDEFQKLWAPPGWPVDHELRAALWEARGGGQLRFRHRFREVAHSQLQDAYKWRVYGWTKWAKARRALGMLDPRDVDRAERESATVIRNTLADARKEIRDAWCAQNFLMAEWSKGSPEQATEKAVHWFFLGVEGIEHAFRGLEPKAEAAGRHRVAQIEQDTARIGLFDGKIADLNDELDEQHRRQGATLHGIEQLEQQAASAAARRGEFDEVLHQARIQRDLQDLEKLSRAETRDDRQLLTLNHLLTLRTYDRIRGPR